MHSISLRMICVLASCASLAIAQLPFSLEPVFTATLHLNGSPSPISIPGGDLVVLPVKGQITGPAINGTILGGFAHPSLYNNQTLEIADIDMYGMTDDGFQFYMHEAGVGSPVGQVARMEIDIGGSQYLALANGFILASANANANRTIVTVLGYLVTNTL